MILKMKGLNFGILGLSEFRLKKAGDFTSEGVRIIHIVGQHGVAILFNKDLVRGVTNVEVFEEKLLAV